MSMVGKTPLIGTSQSMATLRSLLRVISASSSTTLVTGESGTGKELVAQAIHAHSPRADGPFVPLNCGAIPRELIESELFGHRKGAFTGAVVNRPGRFELANTGTLFLDEIGDLPLDMQVKLLRVLQERRILPVGASHEVAVDVRIIAATHRNLEDEVRAGRFREDLYYRINVLPITISALRDRAEDVPELLAFYAEKYALHGTRPIRFTTEMLALLEAYQWPGNVRELSNLVDRFSTLFPGLVLGIDTVPSCLLPSGLAVLQAQALRKFDLPDEIPLAALAERSHGRTARSAPIVLWPAHGGAESASDEDPLVQLLAESPLAAASSSATEPVKLASSPPMAALESNEEGDFVEQAILLAQGGQTLPPEGLSLKECLTDIERKLIEQALARSAGNVSHTAKLLKLQRTTLIEKINKYALRTAVGV